MAAWYEWRGEALLLSLRIQPRASRDEIVGPHGGALKVRVTAAPVDGQANAHLIRFLAKAFGVAKSRVEVVSGETGRDKRIRITAPAKLPDAAGVEMPSPS